MYIYWHKFVYVENFSMRVDKIVPIDYICILETIKNSLGTYR